MDVPRQFTPTTQHGKVMAKFLNLMGITFWILIIPSIALQKCDADWNNQQAKTERFLAK